MRRAGKIALWVLGVLLLLPLVAVAAVLIAANTSPGQRFLAREVGTLSGGMVQFSGLSGRFPDALRLRHLEVRDSKGAWLIADGVVLDWSPTALLGRVARVDVLSARSLSVARLPVPAPAKQPPPKSQSGFSLPVSVDLRKLVVSRAEIGAPVAGEAAVLSLTGHGTVAGSLQTGRAVVDLTRLDGPGTYHLDGDVSAAAIAAHLRLAEPAGGFMGSLARVPGLGALDVALSVDGPRTAEQAVLKATAGQIAAAAQGVVNLTGRTEQVALDVTAPSMAPRPDLSWQSVALHGRVSGSFTKPDADAHLVLTGLKAGGAALPSLVADVSGNQGQVQAHAVLTGAVLPGPKPDLFASTPIDVTGSIRLDQPDRPVTFRLSHPLVTAEGGGTVGGNLAVHVHTTVPDMAPLAALGKVDLRGPVDAVATLAMRDGDQDVGVTGSADFTGGQAPVPAVLGRTRFAVSATLAGQDIDIHSVHVAGRAVTADLGGTDKASGLDLGWHVALPDLSALSPQLLGALTIAGHVSGPTDAIAVTADVSGEAGSGRFAKAPVSVQVRADHLPGAPDAMVEGDFRLAGAPARISAVAQTGADGVLHVQVKKADWKSLVARADLALPKGASVPEGKVDIGFGQIGDAGALVGQDLSGSLHAGLVVDARSAKVDVRGSGLAAGPRRIGTLTLTGSATGIETDPDLNAVLIMSGIQADMGVTGSARVDAAGRQSDLRVRATASLQNVQGAPAALATAATVDTKTKQVTVASLTADWKSLALRLLAPARVTYAPQIAVDRLALGINAARVTVAGRVSPDLAVTATVRNVTPDLAKGFVPGLQLAGVVNGDATLSGTPSAPAGKIRIAATGLKQTSGVAAFLPGGTVMANAVLGGGSARVDVRADAGPEMHVQVNGVVPVKAGGALSVHTVGALNLAVLDPILQASGRQARGRAAVDVTASGSLAAPAVSGQMTLRDGEIQDFTQGVHLTQVTARIEASGQSLRIAQLSANAAPGTLSVTGTVGVLAPGLPVDLHVVAVNAKPLASDLLTARFDADLTVRGQASGTMDASGRVKLRRVDINIPNALPPSVAVLNVRRPGYKPPAVSAAPAPVSVVRLAIEVNAPGEIFVNGHGLFAELGGTLHVNGTSAAPQISGGFEMRRGNFSLAGTTLNFTKGEVGFNGTGVLGRIDPTLNFEADSYQNSVTATLKITGYADAPKIALSSVPDLPQDEVLAYLLFGEAMSKLSPIQIAEIGAALAELSGAVGSGNPLASIQKGLGLDRLTVGGGTNGAGATVEAGRYVAKGVYVGAKQSAGGAGGTQAEVQVDLTKRLKLTTALGSGGSTQGATPENDPGSSIGLSYQFQY